MPWSVTRSDSCPADRPWGVFNDETGAKLGCHDSEESAKKQQALLYAMQDRGEIRSGDELAWEEYPEERKTFSAERRRELAEKGWALADGSFPIENCQDLSNAIQALGRTDESKRGRVRSHIRKMAGIHSCSLPESWSESRSLPDLREFRTRTAPFKDVEIASDGSSFRGLAAPYDDVADLGEFTESVARGAFRKVLNNGDNVPMLWDHSLHHPPLATTRAGTLRLSEDAKGLVVDADLNQDHYLIPTLRSMLERGEVDGMSWGFIAGRGNSRVSERSGRPHREITDFKRLLDVSPTWDKAYLSTSAELRSLRALELAEGLEEAQRILAGAAPQRQEGAPHDEGAGESEAEEQGVPSGAVADWAAAARRRRLREQQATLPEDFR